MTPKIIQDTIISPLEELVNGNVEGWRKNWISTRGMVIYLSEQAKTRDAFHEALQPYYWLYLSDSFTGEDAAYPEFRSFIYTCIDSYQGLGEWFRTKDIDDVVESLARKRKEGRNLMDILLLLLRHGYRPYIKEWNKEKLEENIERLRVQGDRYHGEYCCILHAFYMIETADLIDEQKDELESLLYEKFDKDNFFVSESFKETLEKYGYVLIARPNPRFDKLIEQIPREKKKVLSMWNGYVKEGTDAYNENLAKSLDEDFDYMHTSGHIDMADLREFFRLLHPKAIIPIHTDNPEEFANLFRDEFFVKVLNDGESITSLHACTSK